MDASSLVRAGIYSLLSLCLVGLTGRHRRHNLSCAESLSNTKTMCAGGVLLSPSLCPECETARSVVPTYLPPVGHTRRRREGVTLQQSSTVRRPKYEVSLSLEVTEAEAALLAKVTILPRNRAPPWMSPLPNSPFQKSKA